MAVVTNDEEEGGLLRMKGQPTNWVKIYPSWKVKAEHRHNYWALDAFKGNIISRTITTRLRRKQAEILEGEINNLIEKGFREGYRRARDKFKV